MSIKLPNPNIFDKLLRAMGKKRAVTIPKNIYEKYGQYTYAYCEKESFLKALLRSKNNDLPEGTVDI